MGKGRHYFGHGELAKLLSKRLNSHFFPETAPPQDSSLVVGIFGEWGSGKSNLLRCIEDEFSATTGAHDGEIVIVVPFNPWRYEKEEYLIAPLLKTIQLQIQARLPDTTLPDMVKTSLVKAAKFFGKATVAFARGLKFEYAVPVAGAKVEFDAEKTFAEIDRQVDEADSDSQSTLDKLDTYYFEFEQQIRDITSDSFKLLFLIDDLDRCLPEKAVEMLESIKLFLDVQGCAFVLALDDEVVERGILHRYRDYLFQNGNANGESKDKRRADLPITGSEYMEKIIQLPFRLPLPSRPEIRSFLKDQFGKRLDGAEKPAEMGNDTESAGQIRKQ